ncbi:MAG: hypothetical protein GY866_38205 [Proteobacteria bacterium]|nr:hypothetical protein [Pseudomonadota bacterium]
MKRKIRDLRQWFPTLVMVMVMVMVVLGLFTQFVAAAPKKVAVEKWTWSADFPKPDYWPWDNLKEEPVSGGVLTMASSTYIGLMNPNHWPVNDWNSIYEIYEILMNTDAEYKATFPEMAKSWKYIDSLSMTMELRRGITFHDGTDFDAHTVKYMMGWIGDKKNGAWSRSWIEPIKKVEVVDDYMVKFTFKRLWAAFLPIMALIPGTMISPTALENEKALFEKDKLAKRIKSAEKKVRKFREKYSRAKSQDGSALKKAKKKN